MASWLRPVSGGWISSSFQAHKNRRPPSVNPGTDYAVVVGTDVIAVHAGTVTRIHDGYAGSGGRIAYLDFGGGYTGQLLHLDSFVKKSGSFKAGEVLAKSGSSANGKSRGGVGPHLHFTFKKNGVNIDYEAFRKANAMPITTVNGFSVLEIQKHLTRHGFPTKQDGEWGPATAAQVKAFQTAKNLTPDGIAGKATWAELIKPVPAPTPDPEPVPVPVEIDYAKIAAMIPTPEQIADAVWAQIRG